MNPKQKYPDIIELFGCILNMFVFMLLCPINISIYLGTCLTPKLLKKQFNYFYKIKQSGVFQNLQIYQGLLHMPHPSFY